MQRFVRSWFCLLFLPAVVALTTPRFASAQNTRVNPDEVLTDDVVTRALGLEKDDLKVDPNASPAAKELKSKLRTLMAEAVTLFRSGKGDEALAKFKDAKQLDSALPPEDVFFARLCFTVNDPNIVKLGMTVLNRAADKNPEAPEPYLMFGRLALLEGRLTDAYVLFQKAEQVVNSQSNSLTEEKLKTLKKSVYDGLVSVCEQRQNWEQGLTEISGWINLDPSDPVALFRKGRLIFMQAPQDDAKVSEARKLFDEAYQKAAASIKDKDELPAVPPAELALLELRTASGDVDKAREEISALDRKAPQWQANKREGSRVYSTISQWYLGQAEFKKAEDYAAKATELDKDSPALKQLTAVLHYFDGNPRAETEFTEMNQAQPDDFFAANYLALVLIEAKTADGKPDDAKRAKAVRIAEVNARLNQKTPAALATLGWVYYNTGKISEAAQLFGALEQEKNLQVSPDTAYYMAKTFASLPAAQFPNALSRAKSLLELAVPSAGAFRYRKEAEEWLKALGGTIPPRNNGSVSSGSSGTSNLVDVEKKPESNDEGDDKKPKENP